MKSLRRYCSVLLCCVLLLGAFSVSVSAEELDLEQGYYVWSASDVMYDNSTGGWANGRQVIYIDDGTKQALETICKVYDSEVAVHDNFQAITQWHVALNDKGVLIKAGRPVTVYFDKVYYAVLLQTANGSSATYFTQPDRSYAWIHYTDGTSEQLETTNEKSGDFLRNITLSFTPEKDVQKIAFYLWQDIPKYMFSFGSSGPYNNITSYLGEFSGDGFNFHVTINQQSEEAGLLSGILGWIENIWNTVTDGFTDMKNGITNIVNTIIELPAKIWSYIETGIKNLFVPDEEYLASYKDKWNELLEDKLGAIYQAVYLVTESWEHIQMADEQNTIYIPEVTIELPSETTFTFGGYDVVIVPHKFEWLATSFKTVSAILATWMFIESLRRRYLEVLGTGGVNTW